MKLHTPLIRMLGVVLLAVCAAAVAVAVGAPPYLDGLASRKMAGEKLNYFESLILRACFPDDQVLRGDYSDEILRGDETYSPDGEDAD